MNDAKCACGCAKETRIVLACAGASNVGQLSSEAAKRLDAAGEATFACLAGVSGGIAGILASVKGGDKLLVIDGCPVACAKKTVDAAGLAGYRYQVVTDTGVKKVHAFQLDETDIQKTVDAGRAKLNS
jgi:uncharacterized metal-binding protein